MKLISSKNRNQIVEASIAKNNQGASKTWGLHPAPYDSIPIFLDRILGVAAMGFPLAPSAFTTGLLSEVAFRKLRTWQKAPLTHMTHCHLGVCFFRGPPKWWFSFWFPFKTTKKGVPSNKDPHFGPFKLTLARPWPQPKITQLGGIQGSHGIEWVER